MHLPDLSLVFLRDRRPLAEYGVLPGWNWIRTPRGDLPPSRPEELTTWLAATTGSGADRAPEV